MKIGRLHHIAAIGTVVKLVI